jgi:hypothetical protein
MQPIRISIDWFRAQKLMLAWSTVNFAAKSSGPEHTRAPDTANAAREVCWWMLHQQELVWGPGWGIFGSFLELPNILCALEFLTRHPRAPKQFRPGKGSGKKPMLSFSAGSALGGPGEACANISWKKSTLGAHAPARGTLPNTVLSRAHQKMGIDAPL